jgi:hypothetical protein
MKRSVCFIVVLLLVIVMSGNLVLASDAASDKAVVEKLARENAGLRADWVSVRIESGWAFSDVAEKAADGSWSRMTSILLKKDGANWKILAIGDPISDKWQSYVKKMPPNVKKAFLEWNREHF